MSDVKALYPIGKTQWSKWNDDQKVAFNESRAEGIPYADAIAACNQMKKKVGLRDVLGVVEDLTQVAVAVSGTGAAIGVARDEIRKATKKKGK